MAIRSSIRQYLALVSALTAVALITLGCSEGTETTAEQESAGQPTAAARQRTDLFSATATAATTTPVEDGLWRVEMKIPSGEMIRFADRPGRTATHVRVGDVVARWAAYGFDADPPNAALTGRAVTDAAASDAPTSDAGLNETDVAVELTDPSWDAVEKIFEVNARPIGAHEGASLPSALGPVSLFIDDVDATPVSEFTFVVRNLSSFDLSVRSVSLTEGQWSGVGAPKVGQVIAASSTERFTVTHSDSRIDVSLLIAGGNGVWQLDAIVDERGLRLARGAVHQLTDQVKMWGDGTPDPTPQSDGLRGEELVTVFVDLTPEGSTHTWSTDTSDLGR